MRDLREGKKISYELVPDRRTGKASAENLRPARTTLKQAGRSENGLAGVTDEAKWALCRARS